MSALVEGHLQRLVIINWIFKVHLGQHFWQKKTMSFDFTLLPVSFWRNHIVSDVETLSELCENHDLSSLSLSPFAFHLVVLTN